MEGLILIRLIMLIPYLLKAIFAESTYDDFWGTGLDREGTDHTNHLKWPGNNQMGKILTNIKKGK
jgi:predicted NAD-dependent protein-ADP-ribosyltransferase YbiA (DUF1768 family)